MIGIISAMDEEVISLKRKMHVTEQRELAGMNFFIGTVGDKEIVIVRCGAGKVNAAVCTQILVDLFNIEYLMSTGMAGGLYPELNISDIVVTSDTEERNREASATGTESSEFPHMKKSYFEANDKLVTVAKEAAEHLKGDHKVFMGRVASEDEFICSIKVKEEINSTHTAYCAEMEGAAIAHTCFLNQVPFVMIRSISDKVDQSADVKFEEFVDTAARNASRIIEEILRTF